MGEAMIPRAEDTSDGCMRLAFEAIRLNDTAERDRLCDRARALIAAEGQAEAVQRLMEVNFFVTRTGVCISTTAAAKAAGVIQ